MDEREQPPGDGDRLTHLDAAGRVRMVDVSDKPVTRRRAVAEGRIRMRREVLDAILAGDVEKGEALAVARIAAIGGAKRTSDVIPLCHPLVLDRVETRLEPEPDLPGLRMEVAVSTDGKTGVEMEALTGVTAGLLALYDMCKAMDRGMTLEEIRLLEKTGGASGSWRASGDE